MKDKYCEDCITFGYCWGYPIWERESLRATNCRDYKRVWWKFWRAK